MTLQEAILVRHSVRQYMDKPVEAEKIAQLQALIDKSNSEAGLHMQLTDEQQAWFLQSVERIHNKEQQLAYTNHPIQRKMLASMITLLRQETLMEYAFLFTDQLLHADATPSHKREVLITFLLALNQEYKQHRAVQYYADKQALTPRHFADIIKQESGYTPMEWINMVTINQAKHLLRQPKMLVKQVADELGFPEQFTFRKYFKAHTGISPTEYQNHK